ncbi:MAG TPA: hypothetical protein VGB56_06465, partial [Flavisolibacter sp.]
MRNNLFFAALAFIALSFCFTSSLQKPLYLGKLSEGAAANNKSGTGTALTKVRGGQGNSASTVANTDGGPSSVPGNPVSSFGENGILKLNFYGTDDAAGGAKTFVQSDGKLLVVVLEHNLPIVKRFHANGTPDPTFNLGTVEIEPLNLIYRDAVLRGDDKVIFVGHVIQGEDDIVTGHSFAVGYYTSWGGSQVLNTFFGSNEEGAQAAALQSDGKLVVAGYTTVGGIPRFALARYNVTQQFDNINLAPDPSFSGDGKVTTVPGPGGAIPTDVVIQADGKIVVGGHSGTEEGSQFELARYNSDGSLDLTFSGDGKVSTAIGTVGATCKALTLQPDGKILATGQKKLTAGAGSNYDFATVRYNTNGTLDTGFSGDGMVTNSIRAIDQATSVLVQEDGKIIVSGTSGTVAASDFALLRYTPAGVLDASFTGDGLNTTDFSGQDDQSFSALLQPDGKVVLTGWSDPPGYGFRKIALARYTTSGTRDPGFSGDGRVNEYFSNRVIKYLSTVVQADGKIVAAGTSRRNFDYGWDALFALTRVNPDGTPDPSFGTGGKRLTPLGGYGGEGKALALQNDGKIIFGGNVTYYEEEGNGGRFAIARYHPSGSLDLAYGDEGFAMTNFKDEHLNTDAQLTSVAVQPDGKVMAMGRIEEAPDETGEPQYSIGLARYNLNGSADASFSGDGKLVVNYGFTDVLTGGLAVQSDGKLVVGGGRGGGFFMARFNANGTPDVTFSGDGVQATDFLPSALAVQPDGKIIVSGTSGGNFATARYLSNGLLDLGFNGTGKRFTDFGSLSDAINDLTIQPDGKIIAAGTNGSRFALARYLSDGAMDPSFSGDGKQTTDIASNGDEILSIARAGSRLYAAGSSVHPFGYGTLGILAAYDLGDVNPPATTRSIKLNLFGGSNPYANPEWN